MRVMRVCLTAVLGVIVAVGTTLGPYYDYEQILDRAVKAAQSESLRGIAMGLLRNVAEGHPDKVTPDMAGRLGLRPKQLEILGGTFAKDPGVRSKAYLAIARTGLPEALDYLQALTPAQVGDLGPRDRHEAWPAAQIALQEARLMRIKTTQEQVTFLQKAMAGGFDSESNGKIQFWATQRLCDMGSSESLPLIEKCLRRLYSRIGEAETSFCRERIQVLRSHPTRATALSLVLNIGTSAANQRLTTWAIGELAALDSAEGDAELDRFAAAIRGVGPPERNPALASFTRQIDQIRRARRNLATTQP